MAGMRRRLRERFYGLTGGKRDTDGCALDMRRGATSDEDLEGVVLFADVDPKNKGAVLNRMDELAELHGGIGSAADLTRVETLKAQPTIDMTRQNDQRQETDDDA